MKARVESLPPRVLTGLALAAVLLFTATVWFLVVSPKRADATSAGTELAEAKQRLVEAQAAVLRPNAAGGSVGDVLRLAKAMPSSGDQSGLVLELSKLAQASGVVLEAITPQPQVAGVGGPALIPLSVVVNGRYHDIVRFLERTRLLVTVGDGKLSATGRLLSVRSVALVKSDTGDYPELDATVGIDAYVYDGPVAPAAPPPSETEEEPAPGSSAAGGGS